VLLSIYLEYKSNYPILFSVSLDRRSVAHELFHLHIARNLVGRYDRNVWISQFTDFSFDLKSVNLLLSSVLGDVQLLTPWPCIRTSVAGVSSQLYEADVPTPEIYYQKMWCGQTDYELRYLCLAFSGGRTENVRRSAAWKPLHYSIVEARSDLNLRKVQACYPIALLCSGTR